MHRLIYGAGALVLLAVAGWSCATGPDIPKGRGIPAAWRKAGAALPPGESRSRFLELADSAVAEAERLHRHEADTFEKLTTIGERHDCSRADLYAPLGELAEQRRARLLAYAEIRLQMRAALTAEQWATVVKEVR